MKQADSFSIDSEQQSLEALQNDQLKTFDFAKYLRVLKEVAERGLVTKGSKNYPSSDDGVLTGAPETPTTQTKPRFSTAVIEGNVEDSESQVIAASSKLKVYGDEPSQMSVTGLCSSEKELGNDLEICWELPPDKEKIEKSWKNRIMKRKYSRKSQTYKVTGVDVEDGNDSSIRFPTEELTSENIDGVSESSKEASAAKHDQFEPEQFEHCADAAFLPPSASTPKSDLENRILKRKYSRRRVSDKSRFLDSAQNLHSETYSYGAQVNAGKKPATVSTSSRFRNGIPSMSANRALIKRKYSRKAIPSVKRSFVKKPIAKSRSEKMSTASSTLTENRSNIDGSFKVEAEVDIADRSLNRSFIKRKRKEIRLEDISWLSTDDLEMPSIESREKYLEQTDIFSKSGSEQQRKEPFQKSESKTFDFVKYLRMLKEVAERDPATKRSRDYREGKGQERGFDFPEYYKRIIDIKHQKR